MELPDLRPVHLSLDAKEKNEQKEENGKILPVKRPDDRPE
jgi:hypothetical protein